MEKQDAPSLNLTSLAQRLKADVTVTAPGWAFVLAGLVALVVIGVALD